MILILPLMIEILLIMKLKIFTGVDEKTMPCSRK